MFWTKKSNFKVFSMVLVCAMLMQLSSGLFVSAVAMPFYDTGSTESVVDTGNGDSGNIDDEMSMLDSDPVLSLLAPKADVPMPAGFITSVEVFEKIDKDTDVGTPFAPDKEFAKSERFFLRYNYTIPPKDSGTGIPAIVKGVTYVFDMPQQINTKERLDAEVKDEGDIVADAIIHNGTVKITFRDTPEGNNALAEGETGDFWFQKRFDKDKVNNGGKQTLDFTITNGGLTLEEDINFAIDKVEAKVKMEKTATPNLTALNATSIDWLVTVTADIKDPENPNDNPKVPATITDLVITDTIEDPMLYVDGSVTVKKHTEIDLTGTAVTPNGAVYKDKTITVTIPSGSSLANGEYYTIGYKTTFKFDEVFADGITNKTFTNTAQTTGFKHTQYEKDPDTKKTITTVAENKKEVSATADIELTAAFLDKSGSLTGGKIDWTVTIKPGTFRFTDGTITDTIPAGLTLDKGSVKWGNAVVEEDTTPPPPTPSDGKFSITTKSPTSTLTYAMGALAADETTKLTYTTVVDSGHANLDNSFTNNVNFKPNNGPTSGFDKGFTVHYGGSVFTKTAKDYIPSTHTIPWEISFGETGGTQLVNPTITEVLPEGLTLVEDSIFVTDPSGDKKITVDGEVVEFTSAGTKLGIKLTENIKDGKPALIFTLTGTVKYNHIIKFNTTVDSETYWAANNKSDAEVELLKNTAYINVEGMNEHHVTAKPKVPSQILTKAKDANYDYVTKHASWKIEVNQNQMAITAPTIVDTLETAGLSYVEGSVAVTLNGVPVMVTPTFSTVDGKPTMKIVLPSVEKEKGTYVVKYKTAVADSILEAQTRTIKNTAVLSSITFPKTPATATATQDIAKPLVTKAGKDTGKWYITWSIMINQNGATLEETTIEDVLATGLMLDPSSIKLEKLTLKADGTLTGEDIPANDVTNDGTASFDVKENAAALKVLKVAFVKTITDPYKLTFDTYYSADATFTNSVTLNAKGSAFTANSGNVNGNSNSSGGSTKPVFGKISLIKKDKATAELLRGAVFKLGSIMKTTDASGEIKFDNMRKGQKCTITEVKAPYGYKLAEPIEITVGDFGDQSKFEYTITNTRITNGLTITKTDGKTPATPLDGAEFTVTRTSTDADNNITFEPVTITSGKTTTLKTAAGTGTNAGKFVTTVVGTPANGATGEAKITGLPVGSYTVTEKTAPNGYVLDANSTYSFTVTKVGDAPAHTFTNTQILGSLELTKTDKNDTTKLLAGAEFTVKRVGEIDDNTNNNITFADATITTGTDGKATLNGLPVGTYTVTETEAPNGYVLNATPHPFTIEDNGKALANTAKLTFTNEKIVGTLLVTKTDDQTPAKPLQGAVYTATKTDAPNKDAKQSATTDINGVATFKLAAGSYTVEETKAPSGYVLNATEQTVTIVDNATQPTEQIKLTFTNTLILGSLELTKTDELNNSLEGAVFSVTKGDDTAFVKTITTDANGKAILANLLVGTYTVTETTAPNGYMLDATPQTFVIDDNGTAQPVAKPLTFKNTWAKGKLQISKTDAATAAALAGAEFTILKIGGGYSQKVTTGTDGKAEVTGLARGEYEVTEVKAPKGYQIDTAEKTFIISDTVPEVTLDFTNTFILGSLELTKTDDKTPAKPLEGARFELYNAVGDALVAEGTTDKDGKLRFDNLTEGNYYYKEKLAPIGYVKDETKCEFSITANGQVVAETFKNKALPPPSNGGGHTPSVSPPPEVVIVPPPTAPQSPLPGTPPNTTPQISAGTIPTTPTGTPDIAVQPANGTVTIDKDGKWVYTPKAGFVGEDEFTATVTYPSGYTETFVIKLSVLSGYVPFLPETGEAPRTMFYVGGLLLIMLGVIIKRRLKKI